MAVLLFGMESVKQVMPWTAEQVLEAKSLPQGMNAQLAALVALSSRVKQRATSQYLH